MTQTELKLRTVAEWLTEPEARVEECVLAMQGIPCFWKSTGTVGLYEAFSVEVQVADGNWEAAQAVLHEHRKGEPSWSCAVCGTDVVADFDTCWHCGAERGSTTKAALVVPPPEPDLPEESADVHEVRRAWWASLIGLLGASPLLAVAAVEQRRGSLIGMSAAWVFLNVCSLWLGGCG